jgi:hypothetical protein
MAWPEAFKGELEGRLERCRPEGKLSRRWAYYAFSSLADAAAYLDAQKVPTHDRRYYRVDMNVEHRAPMALASEVAGSYARIAAICTEYWSPTQPWQMWEHLAKTMTILEEIKAPDIIEMSLGLSHLTQDRIRLKQLFPPDSA